MSRILIADDNQQNLYLARFLLEQKGHQVDEASNGAEAVEAAGRTDYDLILMDIQMPVMDGLEATRLIKQRADAPTIAALTAKAMLGDKEMILASGCDGYIKKPIDPGTFCNLVAEYLS